MKKLQCKIIGVIEMVMQGTDAILIAKLNSTILYFIMFHMMMKMVSNPKSSKC